MRKHRTSDRGNAITEFPVVIFAFLICLIFPLIDLSTLFLGASAVNSACRMAAVAAAKSPTFQNDSGSTLSAVHTAQNIASNCSTNGVSIPSGNVQVTALAIPITGGAPTPVVPSPTLVINSSANIYQLQVTVTGNVTPLVMLSKDMFGVVPGLTSPLVINATTTAVVENPQALNG